MVRTRFAPSNTGPLHAGSCRTAIFAYAYAKKMGGEFHLRIEDTDRARSTKESLIDIMQGLLWLGLDWGKNGPSLKDVLQDRITEAHFQSQRGTIYNKYVERLLQEKKAYEQDGAVFFKMPDRDIVLNDVVLGKVVFPKSEQKDFLIRRKDGTCIFHLANVVDDAVSGMTHLIKGNDHVSNSPKHIALFEALGFPVPQYCHLPLILDDKGAKLSKRRTDQFVLIKDFMANGYLPKTIVNMIGLMGWSTPDGNEDFDLHFLCQNFDLKDCLKANSKYDAKKLANFNHRDIKNMDIDRFFSHVRNWAHKYDNVLFDKMVADPDFLRSVAVVFKDRCKTLAEFGPQTQFLFADEVAYDQKSVEKFLSKDNGAQILEKIHERLSSLPEWGASKIMAALNGLMTELGVPIGKIAQPLRVAVTGTTISPPIDQTLELLGQNNTLSRIQKCLEKQMVGA